MKNKIEYAIYPCNRMALYMVTVATFCLLLLIANTVNCFAQLAPKETELQLKCQYYRIEYQNSNGSWTDWNTVKSPIMLAIFPEQEIMVLDDGNTDFQSQEGQNSIYSISIKNNINSKWYSATDANGRPLTVKVVENKDLTYNVELRYENYFEKETGRQLVVGKATEYLNCTIKTL